MIKQLRGKWIKLIVAAALTLVLSGCSYLDFLLNQYGFVAGYLLYFLSGGAYMVMQNADGTFGASVGTPGNYNPIASAILIPLRALPAVFPFAKTTANPNYIFFADFNNNSVGVWDFMSGRFLPSIPVGTRPRGIAISPDGNSLVVSNSTSASVSIIDPTGLRVITTISLPSGSSPYGVAITGDSKRAYVANYLNPGSIFVIDLTTRTLSATIPGGNQPIQIAMSPDGALGYVTNFAGNTVSVIDLLTNTLTTTVSGFQSPSAITTSRNGRYIYVTNVVSAGTVTVLDATTYAVAKTITVGGLPVALAATPDGRFLYVANLDSTFISQISTTDNTVVRNIPSEKGVQTLVPWQ